ncbi:hypothetical protein HYX06_04380 [Candidatus Woesearchaeota archaeon]|nr:hypothetical protein [Candidatus Woesearchaeota archaeon]
MDNKILSRIKEIKENNGNFQTIKKIIGEERLRNFVNSIYPKFSITEIETITGISDSTLQHWFNKLKIPTIRNHIITKSFPSNVNSKIIVSKDGITYNSATIRITPELAYVIGFALGDGSIQRYRVEVFNKDKNLRKVLFSHLKSYGHISEEERENGLWRLRLSNGRIANLIKHNNEIRTDTLDYIFNNDELARQFIAAFWDAEGTVRQQGNYCHIYLYNSNSFLLDRICNFLKSKNIKFSILNGKSRNEPYFLNNRQIFPRKLVQRISIPKISHPDWINEIGFYMNHTKKKKVVKELIKT